MLKTVGSRKYKIDDVLPFVGQAVKCYDGFRVKMVSSRYHVFRKSQVCVSCGIIGTVFLLQRENSNPTTPKDSAHFNLYAVTPTGYVLMTQDHILPKSKGGSNRLDNLVTMCFPCNSAKGSSV